MTSVFVEVAEIGTLRVDRARRSATRYGDPVFFSLTEWRLLDVFFARLGDPVPPADLLEQVWGPASRDDDIYLAIWVWRLRQKLESDPAHPAFLTTVPHSGYRLDLGVWAPGWAAAGAKGRRWRRPLAHRYL